MNSYAAFVGNHPRISIAELSALLPDFTLVNVYGKNVAIVFETSLQLNQDFLNLLGGTLFLAERVTKEPVDTYAIPKVLVDTFGKAKRGKLTFSLRTVGLSPKQVQKLYRNCKDGLKAKGRSSRYVGSERRPAPAVVLHDSGLIDSTQGCELVILADEEENLWVGRTIGAQDIDAYTERDIGKPVRDTGVGLLPPKLAQILLNLGNFAAQHGKKAALPKKFKLGELSVLDPFCGTGVIPIESLLRGWPITASDLSQKAVNGCTKNIEWLRKEKDIKKKDVVSSVAKHDAQKEFTLKDKPSVIVTETTLGPPLLKKPTLKDVSTMQKEIEELESSFIANVAATLPKTPIVCTFPVWYHSKGKTHLEKVWDAIAEHGYEAILPPDTPTDDSTDQDTLLYRRKDQHVGREVVVLIPT